MPRRDPQRRNIAAAFAEFDTGEPGAVISRMPGSVGGRRKRVRIHGHLAGGLPCGGSVSVIGGIAMSEDAPVNTGAAGWPQPVAALFAVQRMQAKLHRWAGEDLSRCFGDLFNLVCDPAFLVHAFGRVASNAGARTAGIDGVTVAQIKAREGGELEFLARLR